jgi:predicted ATPase/DNA-binding CsgD family transcriptional regulator
MALAPAVLAAVFEFHRASASVPATEFEVRGGHAHTRRVETTTHRSAGITRREREVWSLVAAHLTNQEIADRLHLSVRTVESHVSALMQKLHVADRRALARHGALTDTAPRWPAPASSFIGRAAESAALAQAVAAHRMVTATGPGGVGKTRLALRVVESFAATRRDGGRFIDLVHVNDPAMVISAIAASTGVIAPLGGSLGDALSAALADSDAVLLLDNCEHVIDAVRDGVARLLSACPKLSIVATSRVPLRAPFEWVFAVPGLSMQGEGGDAVELFVERARAAGVQTPLDLPRIGELCASLDGMALAIELAAARCRALGLDGLLAGLDRGLRLLSSGAGAVAYAGEEHRHRSLRDAIAWSYRLLSASDRDVLSALSVFASWFDVDAALAVTGGPAQRFDIADALGRLAEHSLLLVAPGEPTRYRALETIRQFGAEQLEQAGERDTVAGRHRQWCQGALEKLAAQARDDAWCERLDRVGADVRAALAWAEDRPGTEGAALLAERLAEQLLLRGRPHESQRCYEQAAALADAAHDRARLLRLAAGAAATRLVGQETLRLLDDAASVALAAGDGAAAAEDLAWTAIYLRYAPGIIAVAHDEGESEQRLERARSHAGGAAAPEAAIAVATAIGLPEGDPRTNELIARALTLAREAGRPLVESIAHDTRCVVHLHRFEYAGATQACYARGALLDRVPLDVSSAFQFNDHLLMMSGVHLAAGHLREAALYADRLADLDCYRDYPHPALARRIKVDAMAGDFDAAVARGERFLAAWERAGRPVSATMNVSAYAMAMVHGLLGDEAKRTEWVEVALLLTPGARRMVVFERVWAMVLDALLALDRGDIDMALARLGTDIDEPKAWGNFLSCLWRPWYAALWAEAAVLAGHADAATRVRRAAIATRENEIAATMVQRAADLLHGRHEALRAHAEAFARLGCDYQRRRTQVLETGASD